MNNEEAYLASQSFSQQVTQLVFTGGKYSEMLNETRGIVLCLFLSSNKQYPISYQISHFYIKIPYSELIRSRRNVDLCVLFK